MGAVTIKENSDAKVKILEAKVKEFISDKGEFGKATAEHKKDPSARNGDRLLIAKSEKEQYEADVKREKAKPERAAKLRAAALKTTDAKEL